FIVLCLSVESVLHSYPTRRSSDLESEKKIKRRRQGAYRRAQRYPVYIVAVFSYCVNPGKSQCHQGVGSKGYQRYQVEANRGDLQDRKSTRLNSSHVKIWYAVVTVI